ncbi:MAG: DUF1302 domain-containing protein [Burkholderiaceae bacterium]|nr:DUF1302 domain-containing protein [Burkholderiaceae bacterium]
MTKKNAGAATKRPAMAKRAALRPTAAAHAVTFALAALAAGLAGAPAHAFKFENEWVKGSLDSTVSLGFIRRMQKTDRSIIGNDNGGDTPVTSELGRRGDAFYGLAPGSTVAVPDFNYLQADDGDLNYKKGDIVSAALKGTHELVLHFPNQWSGMLRATWFKDWRTDETRRMPLDPDARSAAVDQITLLDAWVAKEFEIAGRPAKIKVGNQVISWGEDIFIYGGVNVTNAINLQSAHAPGMQLKEIFRPAPMVSINANVAEGLSVEGYYQFRWNAFKFDPVGTFFSVTDVIGKGGHNAFMSSSLLGLPPGTVGDLGTINPTTGQRFTRAELAAGTATIPLAGVPLPTLVEQMPTNEPRDSGQFGLATRWLPEGSETEYGLYWIRYHDKLPTVGFQFDPALYTTNVAALGYFVDYGESRNVFGISANTRLGDWAVGMELSYRPKDSVGIDATVLPPQAGKYSVFEFPGKKMRGFVDEKKWQAHLTGFKLLAPADMGGAIGAVGAEEGYFLGEVAVAHYPGLDRSGRIPYLLTDYTLPDKTSAGMVFSTGLTYANVGNSGWNVLPQLDVAWDFHGTSPNAAPFIEGRKATTISLNFNRSDKWKAGIGYTRFWGGGGNNLMKDRDFLSLVTSVSF